MDSRLFISLLGMLIGWVFSVFLSWFNDKRQRRNAFPDSEEYKR